jgi:outer membrane protease
MKNISVFALLVIIFVPCAPLFGQAGSRKDGQGGEYAFSIAPQFGLLYGHAEEIVYPTDTKGEYLSQLLWNMKPLFYYGLAADISRTDLMKKWGWFSDVSLKYGIPGKSGVLEDRDWMSAVNSDLTHFSSHDNYTRELLLIDFSLGLSFPVKKWFWVKAFGNVSYMLFRFSGEDGSGKYARWIQQGAYKPIDDSPQIYEFSGKVINYTQEWLIISPGISAGTRFMRFFSFEFLFLISPLLFCTDLDEHLTSKVQYKDYMQWGIFLEPRGVFSFFPANWAELSLELGWRYITGTRGETYINSYGKDDYFPGTAEAGAGLSLFEAGLFFKFRLY